MFDLIPFGRNERNLFNYLDNVERSFWDGSISNMAQFRCDVQDKGDSYLLEAELPGFEREDIGIDLDGTTLVITARHSSESGEKDKDGNVLTDDGGDPIKEYINHIVTFVIPDAAFRELKSGMRYVFNLEIRRGTLAVVRAEIDDWVPYETVYYEDGTIEKLSVNN